MRGLLYCGLWVCEMRGHIRRKERGRDSGITYYASRFNLRPVVSKLYALLLGKGHPSLLLKQIYDRGSHGLDAGLDGGFGDRGKEAGMERG